MLRYIRGFEIIGLTERKLGEFNCIYAERRRDKKKGTAEGGILLGVRKNLLKEDMPIEEELISNELAYRKTKIKGKTQKIVLTYMREQRSRN